MKDSPLYAAIERTEAAEHPDTAGMLYLYAFVPTLTEFVGWVLDKAVESGRKRLYFLSRDGYQMYLTALELTRLRQLQIECRYLHVSRHSMRLPGYHLDPEQSMDRICTGGIDVTLERILKRAALSPEETSEIIRCIGWQDKAENILNYRQIQKLKPLLRDRTNLPKYVERHSRKAYENAMGYLEQEGLLSDVPYAVVDSGWVGTLQESIQTLVRSRRPEMNIEGYYFGMYETPGGADANRYHAWYFSSRWGLRRKTGFSNSLFEIICSAGEGMTLGYEKGQEGFLPVRSPEGNPNRRQLERNVEILKTFLEALKDAPAEEHRDSIRLAERLFHLLMACPTETEVSAYGDSLFSDDVLDGNQKQAAAVLTEQEIRDQRLLSRLLVAGGVKKAVIHESAWIEGSIARCGRHRKRNLIHAKLYKLLIYARKQGGLSPGGLPPGGVVLRKDRKAGR